ncbi:hypothetical protein VHUM_04247 [Vanrija humicola]|uniref:Velvet domain-containing protein n=1 Tax=Vanrija humicola TaxID=5417 RepID=A0A7D8YZ57_VANHU|nr:hypothetical protein VHUM_04247 [Vanrija humicola]
MDDDSDQSSNDSEDDSDELDDAGDEHDRDRELSDGARPGDPEDLTDKELVYVLEVIQQPQRARACGFGDKDRRPLSPPPIIQLRIMDKMGKAISPHSIDFHRFVLMVDLWNGDQSQQRSIVMHPGARQDQYALFTHTTSRPSSSHPYDSVPPAFGRAPLGSGGSGASNAPPVGWPGSEWPMYGPGFAYGGPPQHPPPVSGWPPTAPENSGSLPPHVTSSPAPMGYNLPPDERYEEVRPESSAARFSAEPQHMGSSRPSHSPHDTTRGWTPETPQVDYGADRSFRPATSGAAEGGWRREPLYPGSADSGRPHTATYSGDWDRMYPGGSVASSRPWSSAGETDRRQSSFYGHGRPSVTPQPSMPLTASPVGTSASLYPEAYAERATPTSHYSRVLVGSMGAVCQRLKGLNGDYGLFFFAHDLGIRTEGTFSLRFTLVDITTRLSVGSAVKDDSAPILARIFSKSFTVYSAKRFPGVLPTTDLTQCFADQSVRLPTRQKRAHNGSNSSKRKK